MRQVGTKLLQNPTHALQDEIALAAVARPPELRVAGWAGDSIDSAGGEVKSLVAG
jgi:hypothetical protein